MQVAGIPDRNPGAALWQPALLDKVLERRGAYAFVGQAQRVIKPLAGGTVFVGVSTNWIGTPRVASAGGLGLDAVGGSLPVLAAIRQKWAKPFITAICTSLLNCNAISGNLIGCVPLREPEDGDVEHVKRSMSGFMEQRPGPHPGDDVRSRNPLGRLLCRRPLANNINPFVAKI